MDIATIDFETYRIENRPIYPPVPVGVAIHYKNKAKYLAWDHPTQNNSTLQEAKRELKAVISQAEFSLYHNAGFDLSVAYEHMGVRKQPWHKIHDTLLLAFLHDPRDDSLSLKPMADKYLDMPPEEQDELKNWILENIEGAHNHRKSKFPELFWGALISEAPGRLVGRYAKGDVIRTRKLFNYFYPKVIRELKMGESYDRERKVLPIFESMSHGGVRVDRRRLSKDIKEYTKRHEETGNRIQKRLKQTFDISSNIQLADALDKAKAVDGWEYTQKGNRSTKRENLLKHVKDKKLSHDLALYTLLKNKLGTFMIPWYEKSEYDGFIYPAFHQVRSTEEYFSGSKGTRTGRPSSTNPNLLNVPRNLDEDYESKPWTQEAPNMRNYLIPDVGMVFNNRDYNQQEIRILAHFEMEQLLAAFLANPNMDAHEFARQLIYEQTGVLYPRKFIKITSFGIIYGMGVFKLSIQLGVPEDNAREIKSAYLSSFPGIRELGRDIKDKLSAGEFIRTWGGRVYYEQEPLRDEYGKVIQDFKYKMLNYLIQGSAADCTKQAMDNVNAECKDSRLVLQVYDELMICSPKDLQKQEMKKMKDAMEDVKFDIPMLSEGKTGAKSWGEMRSCL